MLATVSLTSHSPCDTSVGVDLMAGGPLACWVYWRGIFWADANSFLAFEWIQTINLVTARCSCYPMQKRLLCAFWHSTSPPAWLASLAYYQLTVKSQVHLGSPHPDAKGCLHTVKNASVLGCVGASNVKIASVLLSCCLRVKSVMLQPYGTPASQVILTWVTPAPLASSATFVGTLNSTTTHPRPEAASQFPSCCYDGDVGRGNSMDSWGYQKFLSQMGSQVPRPPLVMRAHCSSGRCTPLGRLGTVLFSLLHTARTSQYSPPKFKYLLTNRRISKGR